MKLKQRLPQVRWLLLFVLLFALGSCVRFNTYYNANKAYKDAELIRQDREKIGEDVAEPTGAQVQLYQRSIKKCQLLMENYPGSGLTDEALFLMAKSYHRIASYRMSISKFELLFQNFPANENEEESLYLQAMNYLFIGDVGQSNSHLVKLRNRYSGSEYQADAYRVAGENSFVLEDWEKATASLESYLELDSTSEKAASAELKLAGCYWELFDYQSAVDRLLSVQDSEAKPVDLFSAKLLLGRCLIKLEKYEEVDQMLSDLHDEAEIYASGGLVTLLDAENMAAQEKWDDAAPMIENMPAEWNTGEVGIRSAELMGDIYFKQWKLEEALEQYRNATRNSSLLDNPDRTKSRKDVLERYLTADQRLDTANPEQEPALKLVQANAMLFGMERADLALPLYQQAASADSIDAISAVRGLYGVAITNRDYLGQPDSASVAIDTLLIRYPESPQAFSLRQQSGTLFAYLKSLEPDSIAIRSGLYLELSDSLMAVADSMMSLPVDQRPEIWKPTESVVIATLDAKRLAEADSVMAEEPEIKSFEHVTAQVDSTGTVLTAIKCLPLGQIQPIAENIDENSEVWYKLSDSGNTFLFPGSGVMTGNLRAHFSDYDLEPKVVLLEITLDGVPLQPMTFIFNKSELAHYGDSREGSPSELIQFQIPLSEGYHLIKLQGYDLLVDLEAEFESMFEKPVKQPKHKKRDTKKYRGL
jgi:tetratricopeptide (TPR) repeat protein